MSPLTASSIKPSSKPKLAIIVARAINGVIGNEGKLPWYLPSDLKYFKMTTLNSAVIMGRVTYESIGKPLPQRLNIVVSNTINHAIEGVTVVRSLERAIEVAQEGPYEKIFIIGGSKLYRQALPLVDEVYMTHVFDMPLGDAFFDELDRKQWREFSRVWCDDDSLPIDFVQYERIR